VEDIRMSKNVETKVLTQSVITQKAYTERLKGLAKKWRLLEEDDLALRHETGQLLNERFGDPGNRQENGQEVLKKAAETLLLAQSELSRMRWFAHHFESVEDLKDQYPDSTTWSAVKELLPDLKPKQNTNGSTKASKPKSSSALKGITKKLDNLSSVVKEVHSELTSNERKDLLAKFKALLKAVKPWLENQKASDVSKKPQGRRKRSAA